jgi:chromosome segregation ATPase
MEWEVSSLSPQEANLVEKIEQLRNRIDNLRQEIWKRDNANLTAEKLESELEHLLSEYRTCIREHEKIAC